MFNNYLLYLSTYKKVCKNQNQNISIENDKVLILEHYHYYEKKKIMIWKCIKLFNVN